MPTTVLEPKKTKYAHVLSIRIYSYVSMFRPTDHHELFGPEAYEYELKI